MTDRKVTRYAFDIFAPGLGTWVEVVTDSSRAYVEGYAASYSDTSPRLQSRLVRHVEGKPSAVLGEWGALDHVSAGAVPTASGYAWGSWMRGAARTLERAAADARCADRHGDNAEARKAIDAATAALRVLSDAGFHPTKER